MSSAPSPSSRSSGTYGPRGTPRQRRVEVGNVDHERPAELLLRVGEGPVLHLQAAVDQTISARKATAQESRLLEEPRGAALLTMQRVAYDDHGQVVEFGSHVYAASRYSFSLSMLSS